MLRSTIALLLALTLAPVAFAEHPGREQIIDLLASDETDRIDFTATSFDEAFGRIEMVTDRILGQTAVLGLSQEDQTLLCVAIIGALDDFTPRTSGYTFGELRLVVLSDAHASVLADLVAESAKIINKGNRTHTARGAAESLFRGVVLDIEAGISPLEQLLEHVQTVAGMSRDDQSRFLS
jgi:hypothetical protein